MKIEKINTSTLITNEVNATIVKKTSTLLRAEFILGVVGLIAYVVLATAYQMKSIPEPKWLQFLLLASAVLFGLGFVFLQTLKKQTKQFETTENKYLFERDFFTVESVRRGDTIGFAKHNYQEIKRVKQTERFILLKIAQGFYPIEKNQLKEEERTALLSWIQNKK